MKKVVLRLRSLPAIIALVGLASSAVLVGSAAAATTSISSVISPVISLFTTSGTVNLNVTPTGAGAQTTASDTVTVSTNDVAGYTLQLAETGAGTTLLSGSNTIAATTGSPAVPIALTAGKWGFRVDSLSGFGAGPTTTLNSAVIGAVKYAAVPVTGSPLTLKTTAVTASNDTTSVWYSVAADTTQPSGTYTNSVTYTVTSN